MSEKILGSISCRQNLDLKELRSQSFRPQFQNGRKCCLLTGNPRSLARAMNTDSAHSPRSFLSLIIRSPSCHPPPTPLLPASSAETKSGKMWVPHFAQSVEELGIFANAALSPY
jgi:hypothetical protein